MRTLTRSLLGLALFTSTAAAEVVYNETVVHETTTVVEVDLNAATVLCSSADYGALFLKILIPELAGLTLLDHQNTGAGAPCVASGACGPGNQPQDILDPNKPTENVSIKVTAVRNDEADTVAKTCNTSLTERVHVDIRGHIFTHERWATLGERPFSDCVTSQAPDPTDPTDPADDPADNPADDPGEEITPSGGGCSTTGGSGGLLFALGTLLALRRRR